MLRNPLADTPGPAARSRRPAAARAARLPPSRGQRALWLLDRLTRESGAYVIAAAGRVVGEVDAVALELAFQGLVARHAALRTTFVEEGGEPVRQVVEEMSVGLGRFDARGWSREELDRAVSEEAFRPFDLERGPLVRLALFTRGPGEDRVVLALHHLVADLWSLSVLLGELGVLYDRGGGDGGTLPPVEGSFDELVARQEELLAGEEGERLMRFWERELADRTEGLELPGDLRRPPVLAHRGGAEPLRLAAGPWRRLRRLGRTRGANPFVTALAAFQALLHRVAGQDDLPVGVPTAGRSSREVSDLVGYCVNPVVVRADATGDPPFGGFLERVQDAGRRAFAHQELPFPALVERLEPGRDPGRSPIFQVLFSLQRSRLGVGDGMGGFALGAPGARLEIGSLVVESVRLEPRGAQLDLSLLAAEVGGEALGLPGLRPRPLRAHHGPPPGRAAHAPHDGGRRPP